MFTRSKLQRNSTISVHSRRMTELRSPNVCMSVRSMLLAAFFGCMPPSVAISQDDYSFVAAPFITAHTGRVGWIDEYNVIFSIAGGSTQLGTDCWPTVRAADCNDQRSIQIWNLREHRVSVLERDAILWCVSRGRMTYAKGGTFLTARFGELPRDTGLEAGATYDWDDCTPSSPKKKWVDKEGNDWIEPMEFKQYYEFKSAHFEATRFGYPQTRITWRYTDGREEHETLPDGPWNKSDRLWESYYPTEAGIIVVDEIHNYLVGSKRYATFFPGIVSSIVGVSPSGCQASFFGTKIDSISRKSEVRLYVVRLC